MRHGLIQRTIVALMALALVLGFAMLSAFGIVAVTVAQEKATIIKVDDLSPEQFRKLWPTLPDGAVLEVRGDRSTVGEIRTRLREQAAEAKRRAEQFALKARAAFDQRQAAFLESDKARLAASHKEALAAFDRLAAESPAPPQEITAIREEMWRLLERARTERPQELVEIERRIDYLYRAGRASGAGGVKSFIFDIAATERNQGSDGLLVFLLSRTGTFEFNSTTSYSQSPRAVAQIGPGDLWMHRPPGPAERTALRLCRSRSLDYLR